jgi:hypothetical protein
MGILDKIKNLIGADEYQIQFASILEKSIAEQSAISNNFFTISLSQISTYTEIVKPWNDSQKASFILFLCRVKKEHQNTWRSSLDLSYKKSMMASEYLKVFFRSKMELSDDQLVSIYRAFKENRSKNGYPGMFEWPLSGLFKQIESNHQDKAIAPTIIDLLESIINLENEKNSYHYKDHIKLVERIKAFLHNSENHNSEVKPTYFIGKDAFTNFANQIIGNQQDQEKIVWYKLMALAQRATGSKPSKRYLDESKHLIDELGHDKFKKVTHHWFNYIITLKESVQTHTHRYNGQEYNYRTSEFLDSINSDSIKGFVWMSSWFYDSKTIHTISKLAERSFKKIPGKGPAAVAVGNACLFALFSSKGLDGIAQLSKLKIKIKQNSTLTLIEKYIDEAAKRLALSSSEIEDIAVDDFKLTDYKLHQNFEDYTATLELTGIGKSTLRWVKKDNTEQKSVPKMVKDKFADKLKKLKAKQKLIDETTSVQKERFDRMLRSNRKMTIEYFVEKYVNHGLISFIINKVIFSFSNDSESQSAIYVNKQWVRLDKKILYIENYTFVTLWHPVNSTTDEVKEWRKFLMDSQIQQPFKQAYREIYLLTEAEVNTRTYSNRMASHILKQHQYVTLAKGRNWKAKLIGAWDGGDQDTAQLYLPEFNLKVEYWIHALNVDNEYNETGIWNYVTTDQVRFVNAETNQLLELINVPPIAFSEAMRDVDLFVGVASVGNDPTWSDSGGLTTYRDYWQSYSFGNLSEIAKNRKEILTGLIPRLKIAPVTSIDDRFVVVKGRLRTYKIHIGSTNILMEPNNQYLCIVADRSKTNKTEHLFLPFDGDNGLSVIISKAILLADDDKITDTTITSQINRR